VTMMTAPSAPSSLAAIVLAQVVSVEVVPVPTRTGTRPAAATTAALTTARRSAQVSEVASPANPDQDARRPVGDLPANEKVDRIGIDSAVGKGCDEIAVGTHE